MYERSLGQVKKSMLWLPYEGLVYFGASIFMFFGRYTAYAAPGTLGVSVLYFMSTMKGEKWDERAAPYKRKKGSEAEEYGVRGSKLSLFVSPGPYRILS